MDIAYTEFFSKIWWSGECVQGVNNEVDMQVLYKLHIVYCVIDECTLCVILCIVSLLT